MKSKRYLLVGLILLLAGRTAAEDHSGVDPEALIEQILSVDHEQTQRVRDLTIEAVLTEGERDHDTLIVKDMFYKREYVKYLPDTAWFYEEYTAWYHEGELQPVEKLAEEAKDKLEKKKKRKSMDISYSMLTPFQPASRELYKIEYDGIAEDLIDGYTCHHFRVQSNEEDETRINGDYYFEIDGFHLVRVDFTPSKRAGNLMFKMKKLDMSLTFKAYPDGNWFPREFNIDGKGKISYLFGVTFAGTEIYSNPVINSGLPDEMFMEASQ